MMLYSLATHEPHFSLLREEIDFTSFRNNPNATKTVTRQTQHVTWQLLHISILREYISMSFANPALPWWDLERILDDMVLMLALVGNDFIPHSPSLDIGEGHIALLFELYQKLLPEMGGESAIHLLIESM